MQFHILFQRKHRVRYHLIHQTKQIIYHYWLEFAF
nr:MAG TPA: hypothetical protein [Caudoviricetes sp.]